MNARNAGVLALLVLVTWTLFAAVALGQEMKSYQWDMPVGEIAVFDGLTYATAGLTVAVVEGYRGPITVQLPDEAGNDQIATTGLEVLGVGSISVERADQVIFEDDIYGAMFRFHPDDYEAFITIEGSQPRPDVGLRKLLLHACAGSFRRFWHRGMEAFVPPQGSVAAYVYSAQCGGMMIYQDEGELIGYSMDTKSEVFRR